MTFRMDVIDLIPNAMSFRVITTIDITDEADIPVDFEGRVRLWDAADHLVYVAWYVAGQLHNPGRYHPAYRRFRTNGRVKFEMYYQHGELHDPGKGIAAVRGFYADGTTHYEERYQAGRRCDGPSGEPAIAKWRNDGTLRHTLSYRNGERVR